MRKVRSLAPTVALVALSLLAAGCGSGSGSSSTTAAANEASSQFPATAANKQIVDFGKEAPPAVREAAGSVLAANLKARETANFTSQCSTLSLKTVDKLVAPGKESPTAACPAALKELAEPLSQSAPVRKDTLGASVAAMRVKGGRGYALYHGTDGKDYAMAMEKEGGTWKVAGLLTTQL
jgi:hypothetical protein